MEKWWRAVDNMGSSDKFVYLTLPSPQFTSLQKEIDDHKEEIKKLQAETAKLNNIIRNLEKDIQGLKKEIQERDDTIQDKVSEDVFCQILFSR